MLGISHTANTLVGSGKPLSRPRIGVLRFFNSACLVLTFFAAFVRGVSGGERKRVSLAETMVTRGMISALSIFPIAIDGH